MKELNVTATKVKKKGNTRRLLRHYVSAITYRKVKMAEANCIIGTRVAKSGITCRYTTRIALIKPWRKISTSYEFSFFFFFRETREFYTPVERKRKREREKEEMHDVLIKISVKNSSLFTHGSLLTSIARLGSTSG